VSTDVHLERLARLEDRAQVYDLVMAYGYLEDARRWDDMLALYSDDIERELAGSLTEVIRGKVALRDRLVTPVMEAKSGRVAASRDQVEQLGLRHLIFGVTIEVAGDGNTARASAPYILVATRDGAAQSQGGGFERGSHEGSYEFEFRKVDGTWKFSRQLIVTNNAHNPMFAA
jgi:3-phenylpropionate/cinnamic acid dioxygenase small subunit